MQTTHFALVSFAVFELNLNDGIRSISENKHKEFDFLLPVRDEE